MRKVCLLLVVASMWTAVLHAQGGKSWSDIVPDGVLTHDFGSVPKGGKYVHRFKLVNIWSVPLQVSATPSCSCVKVTPTTTVLQPKQDIQLTVEMDSMKAHGPHKEVQIPVSISSLQSNPGFFGAVTLGVSANIRTDVVLNPGQVNLGTVTVGHEPASPSSIDVEYAGVLDWRITEAVPQNAPVNIKYEEKYRQPGKIGYRIIVSVKNDAQPGSIKQDVFLRTNDPATPLLPIPVEGTVQAGLSVTPANINLSGLKLGEVITKRCFLKNTKPFRIVGIDGDGDGLSYEITQEPAQVQAVVFKYQASKAGPMERELLIKTDLESDGSVKVKLKGDVKP